MYLHASWNGALHGQYGSMVGGPTRREEQPGTHKTTNPIMNDSLERPSNVVVAVVEEEQEDGGGDSGGDSGISGTATIGNEVLNLVKNIVGSGGLSLPAGIAAFGSAPTAVPIALIVVVWMGVINAYSFSLLGRVCAATHSKTYQQGWDRTVGQRYGTKYNVGVGLVVTGKAILGCWSFSIVIASTCQPLLYHIVKLTKAETLIGITILVLLPLCLSKNLSSLAGFSMIGQLGTLVTAFTMALRYFDGTYRQGGRFYDDIVDELKPSFGDRGCHHLTAASQGDMS